MILSMLMAPEGSATPSPDKLPATPQPPWETMHAWAPLPEASTFAAGTENLYLFIIALSALFFGLIMGAMLWFMAKHKRRGPDDKTSSITHSGKIEFLWSAIPSVLLLVIFVWGEVDFIKQSVAPADPIEIRVTGRQWSWTVEYPDYPGVSFTSSTETPEITMMVPKGRPVRLMMTSTDVLHSFYVPAFRVKRDVLPGRYTTMWFEATQVGEFNMFCTEYCGDQHSKMTGVVKVLDPDLFEAALREAGKLERNVEDGVRESDKDYGARIYKRRGCDACHSTDGTPKVGPTWQGLWGRTSEFVGGGSLKVEGTAGENYIIDSIREPQKNVVVGFGGAAMPSFMGQLSDDQIKALSAYIKTLK